MRDIYEVLKQKEADCARLRREIEALRIVMPLMDEQSETTHEGLLKRDAALTHAEIRTNLEEETLEQDAEPRELQLSDAERKGPLSSSLRESSWWRKQGSGR